MNESRIGLTDFYFVLYTSSSILPWLSSVQHFIISAINGDVEVAYQVLNFSFNLI